MSSVMHCVLEREWQEAQTHTTKGQHRRNNLNDNNWTGAISLFTDAAWRSQDRTAGCGWISYDPWTGETREGISTELFVASPLMAEALAVREALLQARALHLSNICLKSDDQVLIKALISKQHPVELYGINLDIENISSSFLSISFAYVPRESNSAADALAKSALYHANSMLRF